MLTAALLCRAGFAQKAPAEAPAFEVASIKPSDPKAQRSFSTGNSGEVMMRNMSLKRLIQRAYDAEDYAIAGPGWLESVRYDISAKMPAHSSREQRPMMIQALLAERFKLVVHRETRIMPGFALVPAKGGLKMQAVATEEDSSSSHGGHWEGKGLGMAGIVDFLRGQLGQPVIDQTGIPGKFNFVLDFAPQESPPSAAAVESKTSDLTAPSLFTALPEKLGLRLTSAKVPVEVLVVDHIEKVPTEN